jgi:hypothetical protein
MIADSNEYALLLAKDPRVAETLAHSIFDHIEGTEGFISVPEYVQICHEALDIWLELIWLSATPEPQPVRDLFVQIATRNWLGQPFGPPPPDQPPPSTSPPPTTPPANPNPNPPASGGTAGTSSQPPMTSCP